MCFKVLHFNFMKGKETVLHTYKAKRTNENPPSIHIKESKIKCNAYVAVHVCIYLVVGTYVQLQRVHFLMFYHR